MDDDAEEAFDEPPSVRRLQRRKERHVTHESLDDSDENFPPVREAGRPQRSRKRDIGPPITIDEKIERLNPIHRDIVEGFLLDAKKESDRVSAASDILRSQTLPNGVIDYDVQRAQSPTFLNDPPPRDGHKFP